MSKGEIVEAKKAGEKMNRAERRAKGIKTREATYNLNQSQIEKMKQDAFSKGCDLAFGLMLAIPVMVIHDKYPKLMRKQGREETFANECLELYELYKQGYVSLNDLAQCLKEETGMSLEETEQKYFI